MRVDAGAAITAGDYVVSAASGFAAVQSLIDLNVSSAGQFMLIATVLGRAMETVASGSVLAIELAPYRTLVNSA